MVPASDINTQLLHPNFEGSPGNNEKIDLPEKRRHGQDQTRSEGNLRFPNESGLELAYIWGGGALQQDDVGSKSWVLRTSFATQVNYLTSLCLGFPICSKRKLI